MQELFKICQTLGIQRNEEKIKKRHQKYDEMYIRVYTSIYESMFHMRVACEIDFQTKQTKIE